MRDRLPRRGRGSRRALAVATVLVISAAGSLLPAAAYDAAGSPARVVEGGSSLAAAPTLEPGAYRDRITAPGESRHYRLDVGEGERLAVSAVLSSPTALTVPTGMENPADAGVDISIQDAQGAECGEQLDADTAADQTGRFPIITWATSQVLGDPDACAPGPLFVTVTRDGDRGAEQAADVELVFAVSPPSTAKGTAPAEPVTDEGPAPSALEDDPVQGGDAYSSAATVGPGTHRVALDVLDTRVLRIHVGEGQRLRWRAEVISGPTDSDRTLRLRVRDPLRRPVAAATGSDQDLTPTRGAIVAGGTAAPMQAVNRTSENLDVASAELSGRQYVTLEYLPGPDDDERKAPSDPVELAVTLEVEGTERPAPQPDGVSASAHAFGGMPWYRVGMGAGALAAGTVGLALLGVGLWRRRRGSTPG